MNDRDTQFLYADDLVKNGVFTDVPVTIAEVVAPGEIKYQNGRETSKPTLRLQGTPKCWEMPKTQYRLLCLMLGKDEGKWAGEKITLHAAQTRSPQDGSDCPAVRVRSTVPTALTPIGLRKWFGKDLTGTPPVQS